MLTDKKREFIQFMLDAGVLRFGQFTTKSGRHSPYFINTGNYKTGAQAARLGQFYAEQIHEVCGAEFEAMFGPAYKGIPLAVSAASSLYTQYGIDKPYFYNRKEEKDHGEGGSLIGYQPKAGDRVLIIEDVITAGTALRETLPLVQATGAVVHDMFISVNRMEFGSDPSVKVTDEVERQYGIRVHSLINVHDLVRFLSEQPQYGDVLEDMRRYMDKYCVL